MNNGDPQPVTLQRLAGTPADAAIVQRIYDAAPAYARSTTGAPGRPGAAQRTFAMLPDGCPPDAKHMHLILHDGEPAGFVDVIRGYPDDGSAYVGLFLLAETHHGRGVGRTAYEQLETLIGQWPGVRRIELSVLALNEPALGFWAAMGFSPTGKRTAYAEGRVKSENVFFSKALGNAA